MALKENGSQEYGAQWLSKKMAYKSVEHKGSHKGGVALYTSWGEGKLGAKQRGKLEAQVMF